MSTQVLFWVSGAPVRYTDRWEILIGETWRIADRDVKEIIRDHLAEHCAADDYLSEAAAHALRPHESSELRLVATDTNELTPAHWLDRAWSITNEVNGPGVSKARLTVDGDHWTLEIATGGCSECEFLLTELRRGIKAGDLFWTLFCESWHRGGRYVFRCDLGKRGES